MNEYRIERELMDYKKMGIDLNQFMGSSSSIGAKRVTNVCIAFLVATEQNNRAGWVSYSSLDMTLSQLRHVDVTRYTMPDTSLFSGVSMID